MQAHTRFGPKADSATPRPDLIRAQFCPRIRSWSPPNRAQSRYPPRPLRAQPRFPPGPPRTHHARPKFMSGVTQVRLLLSTDTVQIQVRLRACPAQVKFRPKPDSTHASSDPTQIHLGFSSGPSQDPSRVEIRADPPQTQLRPASDSIRWISASH